MDKILEALQNAKDSLNEASQERINEYREYWGGYTSPKHYGVRKLERDYSDDGGDWEGKPEFDSAGEYAGRSSTEFVRRRSYYAPPKPKEAGVMIFPDLAIDSALITKWAKSPFAVDKRLDEYLANVGKLNEFFDKAKEAKVSTWTLVDFFKKFMRDEDFFGMIFNSGFKHKDVKDALVIELIEGYQSYGSPTYVSEKNQEDLMDAYLKIRYSGKKQIDILREIVTNVRHGIKIPSNLQFYLIAGMKKSDLNELADIAAEQVLKGYEIPSILYYLIKNGAELSKETKETLLKFDSKDWYFAAKVRDLKKMFHL